MVKFHVKPFGRNMSYFVRFNFLNGLNDVFSIAIRACYEAVHKMNRMIERSITTMGSWNHCRII